MVMQVTKEDEEQNVQSQRMWEGRAAPQTH